MTIQWMTAAIIGLLAIAPAQAGNSTGAVGQVVVGRLGNQVFIEVQAAQYSGWPTINKSACSPCSSPPRWRANACSCTSQTRASRSPGWGQALVSGIVVE